MIALRNYFASVQSIIGATEIMRSIFAAEFPAEMPIFSGFSILRVSVVFLRTPGSLPVAEVPYSCHE
jgi:hypothetical protein